MREKPPATGICADDDFDRNYSVLIFMQDAFEWQCTEEEKKNVFFVNIKPKIAKKKFVDFLGIFKERNHSGNLSFVVF